VTFEAASNATQPEPMLLKAVGALGLRHLENVGSGQLLRALERQKSKDRTIRTFDLGAEGRRPS
jgi:hypothetical protein